MSLELYATFALATAILIAIPGPNVAIIVATSAAHGVRSGLVTVAGIASATVLHMIATVLGLTGLIAVAAQGFDWLRWIGVAYLLYLGIAAFRAPEADLTRVEPHSGSGASLFGRGFLVSLTNPKTLMFYAAFFPQFVVPGANATTQLLLLAATYVAIAVALDALWVLAASRARRVLGLSGRFLNRLTGGLLLTAAAGLALARRP